MKGGQGRCSAVSPFTIEPGDVSCDVQSIHLWRYGVAVNAVLFPYQKLGVRPLRDPLQEHHQRSLAEGSETHARWTPVPRVRARLAKLLCSRILFPVSEVVAPAASCATTPRARSKHERPQHNGSTRMEYATEKADGWALRREERTESGVVPCTKLPNSLAQPKPCRDAGAGNLKDTCRVRGCLWWQTG